MLRTLLFLSCLLAGASSFSQATLRGTIVGGAEPLIGVSVVAVSQADTSKKTGTVTDLNGAFVLENLSAGKYSLRASYIGYESLTRTVTMGTDNQDLGNISLKASSTQLGGVTVEGTIIRSQQNGDTTSFNANAFKTNPDANAEELVTKMPGVTSENGTVKVNGEQVKQVLVDGKPFFGDDPNAALKNLPAEIIDKIQVFDRQSDQAAFTGFDDGNGQKSINIITKRGRNNGVFGRINGGYGVEDGGDNAGRYTLGGNINFFKGDRRISIVGLANNVNQQNFSSEDLLGVSGSSGGGGRGGPGGGGRGQAGQSGGGGGNYGGGGDASNFQVAQQGGITATQAAGINYTDQWSKKLKVSGSYFFNRTDNTNQTILTRNYITGNGDSALRYDETGTSNSINYNHRANLRLEWTIDSSNSLFITPSIRFQDNTTTKNLLGITSLGGLVENGRVQNTSLIKTSGYNLNNNLTFRHRFAKQGRSISLSANTGYNDKTGNGSLYSLNEYTGSDTATNDQQYNLNSDGLNLSGNLTYTEPITKRSQFMLTYNPGYTKSNSDRETFNRAGAEYSDLDTGLSNKYNNTYVTNRGGVGYRYADSIYNISLNLNAQDAKLDGVQTYPTAFGVNKRFFDILPQANANIRFSRTSNLRIFYRTSNNAPTIAQLQNIVDNSNPLFLRTGNPDLRQDYTHSLSLRYGKTGGQKGSGLFLFASGGFVRDYIGNETIIALRDTVVGDVFLNRGTQLSRPVNLDGSQNARAFITYSLPVKPVKSNFNFNVGFTYNRTPAIINNLSNFASNYATNGGLVISSNISENLDFTLSYSGAYTIVKNTLQNQSDYNYYSQTTSLRLNYIFLGRAVFNTNLTHTLFSGLGEGYDRNFLLWNASLGYKFLKNKSLMADVYAFDILKQNNAISRTITETYVEDSRSNVLQRYFMLRLTYTLRQFKAAPGAEGGERRGGDFRPDGPPPGGGGGFRRD